MGTFYLHYIRYKVIQLFMPIGLIYMVLIYKLKYCHCQHYVPRSALVAYVHTVYISNLASASVSLCMSNSVRMHMCSNFMFMCSSRSGYAVDGVCA